MKKILFSLTLLCAFCSCSSDKEDIKDMTKPVISDKGIVANPIDCQVYKRGEQIPFYYVFTDDIELGNYNIEIHNNFDHHTHGTSAIDCEMEEERTPVKPWVFNQSYDIPDGLQSYTARIDIDIPDDIDSGDYHFMIRVTDRAGWQELKAMAIKIVE